MSQLAFSRPRREHSRVDRQRGFGEVRVFQGVLGGRPLFRVVRQEALDEVQSHFREHVETASQLRHGVFGEFHLLNGRELVVAGPDLFVRSAQVLKRVRCKKKVCRYGNKSLL